MKKGILLALLCSILLSFSEARGQSSIEDLEQRESSGIPQGKQADKKDSRRESKTIRPLGEAIDPANPPDGIYYVRFAPEDLVDGILSFHLYTQDRYDEADIRGLCAGDTIVIRGESVPVRTLERRDQRIELNGGLFTAEGYDLCPYEKEGCWKVCMANDHNTYTEQGESILPFTNEITFRDTRWLYQPATLLTGAEAVMEAIEESSMSFTELNTKITVEDEAIARIETWYIP